MVDLPREVFDLLTARDPGIYKAIVTVSAEGIPNVAPMGSIAAMDWDIMVFGDVALVKTRENLEGKNKRAVIAIYQAPLTAYQVKGTFIGFQDSGQLYEQFAQAIAEMGEREGAPAGARELSLRAVGLVAVDEVYSSTPGWNSKKLA